MFPAIVSSVAQMLPEIPGYDIVEQLYLGARTAVYRAVQQQKQRSVVIKVSRQEYPSFEDLVQFRNQYIVIKDLNIPGIVRPLSLETFGNGYALIMEDVGGIPLGQYARQPLALAEVLEIAIQIADILHDLSERQVVHKDIKPANILIHPESKQVKLIDFSIASLLPRETQELKSPNVLEGTLAYLAPEQTGRMNCGIDYRADFYSLGVSLYELLTGTLPFVSDDPLELMHCHIAKTPVLATQVNPKIPTKVAEIVGKLMAKNVEGRYQSALGLKYDLEQCLSQWERTEKVSDFELGARDLSDRFLIPEKLYGREVEVQTLLAAFERVAKGSSELMLVAGFSGIGKTVAVNEVHKPIVRQRGYFIKGKFDQFNRNVPLSAFVQALRNLMHQLLSESDVRLEQWRAKILAGLGENGQVLIDVIPELEKIIGAQPSLLELSGGAAQHRFNLLFQKFVEVFTLSEHPLVLFLDDLQWADSTSLQLLKLLMADNSYLLILGAYRDNEVSLVHPFMLTVEEIKKSGGVVHTTILKPLALSDTNRLVADTLNCEQSLAQPLTELINRKTQGNPFFTTQFLKRLYEEGAISFNRVLRYWECDIEKVNALSLTDDVVEFVSLRLRKLSAETQQALTLAACIGNQFDLETLAIISKQSRTDTATALWEALQEGLILPMSRVYKLFQEIESPLLNTQANPQTSTNPTYRFLHDRTQQAAYFLIPESERSHVHYEIGKLLLEKSSPTSREQRIFELVNQLNHGIEQMSDRAEKNSTIELNLLACRKARAATAYRAAYEYAQIGFQLLDVDTWQNQYTLTLALHELAADAASLCGEFEQMDRWIAAALEATQTPLDQINLYQTRILALASQKNPAAAVAIGKQFLVELGFRLPDSPTKEDIQLAVQEVVERLEERPVETLFFLPEMTDRQQLAVQQIAATIVPMCYVTHPTLYPLMVSLQVKRSIQFGNSPSAAVSYACYGCLLISVLQSIELAQQFGKLAHRLALEPSSRRYRAAALVPIGFFLHHRGAHLEETLPILQAGYQVGVETGALFDAGCCALFFCGNAFWCAQPLVELESQIKAYLQQLSDFKLDVWLESCSVYWKGTLRLCDPHAYQSLLEREKSDSQAPHPTAYRTYYLLQFTTSFLLGEISQAARQAAQVKADLQPGTSTVSEVVFYFYDSLVSLATMADSSGADSSNKASDQWQQVEANQTQLVLWAHHAPMNHLHKWQLVEAERCRVRGQTSEAIDLYDCAIAGASANGYLQEEAIANELAAKFYLGWGKPKIAAIYMQEAYYGYAHWGAKAKIQELEHRYPVLLAPILQQQPLALSVTDTLFPTKPSAVFSAFGAQTSTIEITSTGVAFDLATVLKASQTLSSEIQLDKLLARSLQTILENAGADKGALLMPRENQWFVEVVATVNQPAQIEATSLLDTQDVPKSLVNTVRRSLRPTVAVDASVHPMLCTDTYVLRQQPKSILCIPILHQGKLVAILYLENQITAGAFTSDRIELLNFLCAQTAISLENARLYRQAQTYAQQLEKSQLQIVQSEKMASLGNLVAGVAHEINNPLGFLSGSIDNVREYMTDVFGYIELFHQHYPQLALPIREYAKNVDLDFLQTDLPKILDSMLGATDRIESISTSLRTFSRMDTEHKVSANLEEGIESTLLILKYRLKSNEHRPAIQIIRSYEEIPPIDCFAGQLNQVFMNILANAIDIFDEAAQQSSFTELEAHPQKITIKTRLIENNEVEIRISDNGKGMTAETKDKIFDHLFTTKEVGKGTGLGLAIAQQIVTEAHSGQLEVHSELGSGTEFCICLPMTD